MHYTPAKDCGRVTSCIFITLSIITTSEWQFLFVKLPSYILGGACDFPAVN